jgi:hypothetical protein
MKTNRRKFFQVAGLASTGLVAGGIFSCNQPAAGTSASCPDSIRKTEGSNLSADYCTQNQVENLSSIKRFY